MKAIVVHEFGGPEVLKLEEVPTPSPAAGQVLVRIRSAGVNPYDTYMRNGVYTIKPPLPYTPGSDGAGDVETVGEGVHKVKPGDRVYVAKTVTGAYAEYALTLESQVHPLPAKITYGQGAGLWVPYGTAYHALYQCTRASAGETVLIHVASDGVGIAAVQTARAMGLTVLGTAGTDKGIGLVKREGAHSVFDHTRSGYWGLTEAEENEIHSGLIAGLENGTLRPVVGKEFPLAEAARTHKEVLEPGAFGKIILVP